MGPPLFLGYLRGVPFWWTIQHCWLSWSVALLCLLLTFYYVGRHNFRREAATARQMETGVRMINMKGLPNIFFLATIVGAVFLHHPHLLCEAIMSAATVGSYFTTPK